MLSALRWLMVPVSTAVGCWLGIAIALLLYASFDFFCPADQRVSGMCHASWFHAGAEFSQYAGAAIGAAIAVALPFFTAPSHKRAVATLAFLAGAAYALTFSWRAPGSWPYAAAAIATGLAVLAWAWHTTAFAKTPINPNAG